MIHLKKQESNEVAKYSYKEIIKIGGLWKVDIGYDVVVAVPQDCNGEHIDTNLIEFGVGQTIRAITGWEEYKFIKYNGVITLKNN